MFDESAFLATNYNEAGSTRMPVVPEGSGWIGVSKKLGFREFEFQDKDTGNMKKVMIMTVTWEVEDPKFMEIAGRKTLTVGQEFWLDLKADKKTLDFGPGKNMKLSQLREEYGQNGTETWNPKFLLGKSAMLDVSHRTGSNGETYASVTRAKKIQ
jgi:hypothetical protein